ncbi:hypothetical protein AMAG_11341 [Allomyces macrogynus ATCC 38327]|uniref:t-SNARE coiled-coil homology domain-containing protein n=1 Tax=Allomyces macrogynus (strain ATCC 38327) TaxID=578462 RepID=A0A0L0SWK9_ALLM3|nr:hypothetical protein AMAG_11341 [Allomyces macrogynus ATCC 38327]|eukprot:KNE66861.1 hypothetical protein AMAG_11341 [Allomyces macrogynus ATCC 38327]
MPARDRMSELAALQPAPVPPAHRTRANDTVAPNMAADTSDTAPLVAPATLAPAGTDLVPATTTNALAQPAPPPPPPSAAMMRPPAYENEEFVTLAVGSLGAWLRDVSHLHSQIRQLNMQLAHLEDVQRECAATASPDPWNEATTVAESIQAKILQLHGKIINLDSLKTQFSASDNRIAATHERHLLQTLLTTVRQFRNLQSAHHDRTRDHFQRQLRIVKTNVEPDELDWVHQSGAAPRIFTDAVNEAATQRDAVAARHHELVQLEKSVQDLNVMAVDLAHFIDTQDRNIAQVVEFADDTANHMESGQLEVDDAATYARKARRKKWIILFLVLLIAGAATAIVLGVALPGKTLRSPIGPAPAPAPSPAPPAPPAGPAPGAGG